MQGECSFRHTEEPTYGQRMFTMILKIFNSLLSLQIDGRVSNEYSPRIGLTNYDCDHTEVIAPNAMATQLDKQPHASK